MVLRLGSRKHCEGVTLNTLNLICQFKGNCDGISSPNQTIGRLFNGAICKNFGFKKKKKIYLNSLQFYVMSSCIALQRHLQKIACLPASPQPSLSCLVIPLAACLTELTR